MDFDFDDEPSVQAAPSARAGARFKPKARPIPKKKQVTLSTSQTTNLSTDTTTNVKLSTQSENLVSLDKTLPEKNVNVIAEGVNRSKEQSMVLRACTEKRSGDPETQNSTTFEDTHAQREEEECHLDMETLDIVQEEGTTTTNAYEKHSGKFQPKPRVMLETVIEQGEEEPESQSHNNGYFTNESEFMVNDESRNDDCNTNTTFNGNPQQQEERNVPEVQRETEEEITGRESIKMGKSKRPASRKRKTPIVKDPIESSENTEKKKKFKHSSRRQKRTLEKELLETPDDEIGYLPIRDMLRLVEYKEWLEKKEAKGAVPVVQPTQESNVNAASDNNQYYFQGFGGEEDEFAMEETENQETDVVKPDSPVNYQTYMNKTSRIRWSKQDTELFYEGIREFGSNLSMVQQLFPDRTREQIKLKFKLEERRYPLKLNDALANRSKHLIHFHNVIKKLQQEAAAAREGEEENEEEQEEEARAEAETETTTDVPENEETERAGVKESEGGDVENGVRSASGDACGDDDDDDDDDDFWNSYKSEL